MLQRRLLNCLRVRRLKLWKCVTVVTVLIIVIILTSNLEDPPLTSAELEELTLEKHKMRGFIDVEWWVEDKTVACNGNFVGYGEEFVRLRYARINSRSKQFSIPCEVGIPEYTFQHGYDGTPLQSWLDNMIPYPQSAVKSFAVKETTTVVIERIEAHNLYHTMCEWYNVFILSKLLNFNPSDVDILFMDDRPQGHMDETWNTLFKKVTNYASIESKTAYTDLLWNVIGYESPLNHHFIKTPIPYLEKFRNFFLDSFNIKDTKGLDCDQLTVTFVVRRDYMTHPERINITVGLLHRKFQNEQEIINNIKMVFSTAIVNIVILEEIGMGEQLRTMTNTDILIGMHGAAMTHILFLPSHAVVFEIFPKYFEFFHHFKAIARSRNIKYFGWQNTEDENEFPGFNTHIPDSVVTFHCSAVKHYICGP